MNKVDALWLCSVWILLIQCEAPLTALLIVAPPMRHSRHLATSEEQEDEEHVEIEPGIKGSGEDVVPAGPDVVALPVGPEHDDKTGEEGGGEAGADVAVEVGQAAEEDGGVPEAELALGELAVEDIQDDGDDGADEEAVGEGLVDAILEEADGADEDVLHAHGEVGGEALRGPLVRGVLELAGEVVALGVDDPADDAVVDGDADEGAEDLGEEDGAGRDVHVVADLHVLEVPLGAVPGVAGDGAVDGGAGGVLVAADGVDHEAVEQLVDCTDGLQGEFVLEHAAQGSL